jgi:branched-subunit amino acid aminotransferase/4-amino-4-deoxychorismate lyase
MTLSAEPLAFLHGRVLPQSRAQLALNDAGFVMGATVTDLCRTFHQRLYRWNEHLARFGRSCRAADIEPAMSEVDISARAEEILVHNRQMIGTGQELALVMFATPGPIGYYLGEAGGLGDAPVTFGLHTFPLPLAPYRRLVEKGASLVVPAIRQVPPETIDPHIKQRSRMHWWLADREARRLEPGASALLLDHAGNVTETAAANFLIVRGGAVLSPPRSAVLEGISLAVVRELCAGLSIPFAEQALTLEDCLAADEAMLANTSWCLAGVSRLQGQALPFPGPILGRLLSAWNEDVGLDVHGQIKCHQSLVTP